MLCDKKNELLWEADKHCSPPKKKTNRKKKFQKIFFEKDSKNSNLDFTPNVVKRLVTKIISPENNFFILFFKLETFHAHLLNNCGHLFLFCTYHFLKFC